MNSTEINASQAEAQAAPSSPAKDASLSKEADKADQSLDAAPESTSVTNQEAAASSLDDYKPKSEAVAVTGEAANATVRVAKDS